ACGVDPCGKRVVYCTCAREGREERRMNVHHTLREAVEEGGGEQVHVARQHDEVDATQLEPVCDVAVACVTVCVLSEVEDARRNTGSLCSLERADRGAIGRNGGDRKPRVDERLQVAALARDEDADHASS